MRVHFIQHVPFERPAGIGEWAEGHGFTTSVTKIYRPPRTARAGLPPVDELDVLVILGGPMSVHDTDDHPWLNDEIGLIAEAIRGGKKVIGVCLGAQLIARAVGADVHRARFTEIGWYKVRRVDQTLQRPVNVDAVLPEHFPAFHWHSDAFDVPETATLLLESDACQTQAFVIPEKALGLQFHLEMGPENVGAILENCESELGTGRYVQSPDAIRAGVEEHGSLTRALLDRLLDWFILGRVDGRDAD